MLKPMQFRFRFLLLWVSIGIAATALCAADAKSEAFALLKMQQEAWNRGDLSAFLEGYEKSPDISFVSKAVSRGFKGLEERYRRAYGDREKMGELTFSELEFKSLGENYAFVFGRFELKRSEAGGGDASGRFTVVLRKTADGWRIIHDHTGAD